MARMLRGGEGWGGVRGEGVVRDHMGYDMREASCEPKLPLSFKTLHGRMMGEEGVGVDMGPGLQHSETRSTSPHGWIDKLYYHQGWCGGLQKEGGLRFESSGEKLVPHLHRTLWPNPSLTSWRDGATQTHVCWGGGGHSGVGEVNCTAQGSQTPVSMHEQASMEELLVVK